MAGSISSALLLLLNMAGALLAPSPGAPFTQSLPASAGAADDDGDVDFFFFPFLVLYKSGRVERFVGTDTVPASVDPATGVASKDVVIDASAGLAVRLYLPSLGNSTRTGSERGHRLPLVVFYHGGGFVTESAFSPTYQRYLNALVSKAGALVVSVDYHLSPEHRLPAAYEDAWTALRWVLRSARSGAEPWLSRRADLTRLFLVGDSAGGNIAHNMAMRAGREGLDGGATVQGIALLDPYFWGKHPVPSETQDPVERRLNDRIWSFICGGRSEDFLRGFRTQSLPQGMAASQPNKPTMKVVEDKDGESEMPGWWEKAARKVREEEAAALERKKQEEFKEKMKEKERMTFQEIAMRDQVKIACEKAAAQRQKDIEERCKKLWAFEKEKKERKNNLFIEKVVHEAHLIGKMEDEEEEERKKKKGKGPCSKQ